jgi:hypothetical protein
MTWEELGLTKARDADGKVFLVRIFLRKDRVERYAARALANKSGKTTIGPFVFRKDKEVE